MRICDRSMPPASPGNFSAATRNSCGSATGWSRRRSKATLIKPRRTSSRGTGGYDFEVGLRAIQAGDVRWTAEALPNVVQMTTAPAGAADPKFQLPAETLRPLHFPACCEQIIEIRGNALRVRGQQMSGGTPVAVLLPLDRLFDIRADAALRLWRSLTGRNQGPSATRLSQARRDRLILALRALDGRLAQASYHQIADALFSTIDIKGHMWKSHDIRDRTIRLTRYGQDLMNGGYRLLLLHPYRRRR